MKSSTAPSLENTSNPSRVNLTRLGEALALRCSLRGEVLDLVLAGFACGTPVLIEDVPGTGKTTLARSLALLSGLGFSRIQCAPDLLPGDIVGSTVWSAESRSFVYKPGPIMRQVVLVDELNRAGTRTQAALLEAMEEGQVSVDGASYPLPQPFFLVATQNPNHFAGTYQLPEAQLDRFGLCLSLGYPPNEVAVLQGNVEKGLSSAAPSPVLTQEGVFELRKAVEAVSVARVLYEYTAKVLAASRLEPQVALGLSPRAGIHWLQIGKALAFLGGRSYLIPEDLMQSAAKVLAHRLILAPEARLDGKSTDAVLRAVLGRVPVPSGTP